MIGATSDVPPRYSAVLLVPLYALWCCRPNACPDSCSDASATYFAYPPPRLSEKTQTTFCRPLVKLPTYATPPAPAPSHALLPPITTASDCPSTYDPGSTVL